MPSGFPSEKNIAEMFGFDPQNWQDDRKARKEAARQNAGGARPKARNMANSFIGEGVRMAEQGVNAQMKGVHTAEQLNNRQRDRVETTTTTKRVHVQDAEDLKAQRQQDEGPDF